MTGDETAGGRARVASLLELRRWDEAERQLGALLAQAPTDASLLVLLSRARLGAGRNEQALGSADAAIAADPGSFEAHYWRASVLLALGDPPHASAQRALELAPHNTRAWFLMTRAHLSSGDLDDALAAAQEARTRAPADPVGHHSLGLVHLRRREWQRAEDEYRAALALAPTNSDYLNNLGLALLRQGNAEAAIDQFVNAGAHATGNTDLYRHNAARAVNQYVQNPDSKLRREAGIPLGGAILVIAIAFAGSPAIALAIGCLLLVAAIYVFRRRLHRLPVAARLAAHSTRRERRNASGTDWRFIRQSLRHAFARVPWRWTARQWVFVTGALALAGLVLVAATTKNA